MISQEDIRRRAAFEAQQAWKIGQILGGGGPPGDFDPGPVPQMISASDVVPTRVEWLWPGRIPLGTLSLFSGDPKLGKSLAALSVIAAVTRGGPLPGPGPDGPAMAARGSVILVSAEDDTARTIVPRLLAAGADLDRVKILTTMLDPELRGFQVRVPACERMPTLSSDDLQAIERRAAALGDCRLIVFDPVSDYVGVSTAGLRQALAPLRIMAARLNAAVMLITHHNKGGGLGTNGKYRVRGSIDYVGVCRANFLFLPDPDDPTGRRRLMLDNGVNLAAKQPGLAFIVHDDNDGVAARVEWLPETVDLDADAALTRAGKVGKSGTSGRLGRRHACEEWLRGYLAGGPRSAKECEQAALAAGFNRPLLERARGALAVRCCRSGFGKGASYHLSLPGGDSMPSADPDFDSVAHAPQIPVSHFRAEHEEHEGP